MVWSQQTISKSGQEWTLSVRLEQLKTGKGGKELLQKSCVVPHDLATLWDKTE